MKAKPYFSIIVPTLNEEMFLPHLLQDLARQTLKNFEVIIVDGKSTDKTKTKSLAFQTKLPSLAFITSKKRNVSIQRNLGAKNAQGKYFLFVDADSRLPRYFIQGIKYQISRTQAKVFTCWCQPDSDKAGDKAITTLINLGIETSSFLEVGNALGAMIGSSRKAFQKTGGFDPKVPFAEDSDFVRTAFKKGLKFRIFHHPKYTYSLRRLRKSGLLKSAQKYAQLHLKRLTKTQIDQETEYPMGGHLFSSDKPTPKLFNKIIPSLKSSQTQPKLFKKIKSLLNLYKSNNF